MAATADQRPNLHLTVDRGASASAPDPAAPEPIAEAARLLMDAGEATCITDARGELLYANAAFERIAEAVAECGISPIGRPVREPGQAAEPRGAPASLAAARDPGARKHTIVVGGAHEAVRLRTRLLRDAAGAPCAQIATFAPVTEAESTRARMAAAIERLDDITRLVSDWVWETNRDLVLSFVSPRVNEALGYHQVELTGRPLTQLLAEPSAKVEALREEDGRRPFRDLEVRIAHKDGTLRHVLLSGLPVYCPEQGTFLGYRGTAHDVSELTWRQEALLRAKEDAELANRTKSEFLASMSHELRTPLNAIIGFSDIMGSEMLGPLGSAQYKDYTGDIADSARHLLALINDILDAAKIEAGEMSLAEEVIDPRQLVESVRRLMAPRAARAKVTFELHVAADAPALSGDLTKLRQVLINLVSNAIKFTLEGGRVSLGAEAEAEGGLRFVVGDSGIGIAPEDIPRAMAPFGQVDTRLSRKFEGTGLGLPLAKCLTELHGGRFELASEPGVGTTAIVRLPAARVLHR